MDYVINIIVNGEDRASAPLRNVGGALGNMAQIAGGILGADMFRKIASGVQGFFTSSLMATEGIQKMQVGMEGLIARELQQAAAAEYAASATGQVAEFTKNIGDFLPQATEKAAGLMEELANIAILSPYQVETIQNTYRTAMAFGYTTDEAKKYTEALLNVAAGSGASNEMLGRMAYNFAQIRMQGRVTAVDIRQLAMAGFDLTSVLKYVGQQFGVTINDHNDFNKAIEQGKITWAQFNDSFSKYAEENFGGASERMARTLSGLRSTFKDIFTLTMPKILAGSVEHFTKFANRILDSFLKIRSSGILEKLADWVSKGTEAFFNRLEPFVVAWENFMDMIGRGVSPMQALTITIGKIFGVDTIKEALAYGKIIEGIETVFTFIGRVVETVAGIIKTFIGGFLGATEYGFLTALANGFLALGEYSPIFQAIGQFIFAIVIPAFQALSTWIQTALIPAIVNVATWISTTLVPALAERLIPIILQVATWVQTQLIPALLNLWNYFAEHLPGAIQVLVEFWRAYIEPSFYWLYNILVNSVIPVVSQLATWFIENLPAALEVLHGWFDAVILPLLQRLGNFLLTTVFPVLATFWDWLKVNLPIALAAFSDYINTHVMPRLNELWDFIKRYVWPVIDELSGVIGELVEFALKVLVAFWDEYLQPALEDLWVWVKDNIIPAITDFVDWINKLVGGAEGIKSTFQGWIDKLREIKGYLGSLAIPDWLTPGSPTPLELGIRGITSALDEVNRGGLSKFGSGLMQIGALQPATAGTSVTIGQVNIHAQPGQDGAVLFRQFKAELEREVRSQQNAGISKVLR